MFNLTILIMLIIIHIQNGENSYIFKIHILKNNNYYIIKLSDKPKHVIFIIYNLSLNILVHSVILF